MYSWRIIIPKVLANPAHEDLKVDKSIVVHPLKEGFVSRIGEIQGQKADYGKRLSDGKGIHVREYTDCFLVHWDVVDPSADPIGHILNDAPHWIFIGALALFVIVLAGLALSRDAS